MRLLIFLVEKKATWHLLLESVYLKKVFIHSDMKTKPWILMRILYIQAVTLPISKKLCYDGIKNHFFPYFTISWIRRKKREREAKAKKSSITHFLIQCQSGISPENNLKEFFFLFSKFVEEGNKMRRIFLYCWNSNIKPFCKYFFLFFVIILFFISSIFFNSESEIVHEIVRDHFETLRDFVMTSSWDKGERFWIRRIKNQILIFFFFFLTKRKNFRLPRIFEAFFFQLFEFFLSK